MLIDSHCHLDYFNQPGEQAEVIERARAAGVGAMVTIGVTLSQSREAIEIAEKFENVWACVGIHPNHAADELPVAEPEAIAALAAHPKVIGIGESGLDYFYDKAPRDIQEQNFRANIRAAQLRRPAARHPCPRGGRGYRAHSGSRSGQRGHFDFLLHCFSSGANWPRRRSKWADISPFPGF